MRKLEFDGQHLLTHDEAGEPGATAAAVLIGDSPEEATFDNLEPRVPPRSCVARTLIGMHRNPWWLTPEGPTLDSGAFVVGLEFSAGVRAIIAGKPSPTFYLERRRGAAPASWDARSPEHDIAMVGDDIRSDVLAAQRGRPARDLRAVRQARTGRPGARLRPSAAAAMPDAVAPSLAEVVAALD